MERSCGIYLKTSSFFRRNGGGCTSKNLYDFIDFLSEKGVKVLMLDDIHEKDDEGRVVSHFAIDPMLLSTDELLVQEELDFFKLSGDDLTMNEFRVNKSEALRYVFDKHYYTTNVDKFISDNETWVYDYAVYSALKDELGVSYQEFPEHYKNLDSKETILFIKSHSEEIIYYIFIQYLLTKQWKKFKSYANLKGIKLIIGVSEYYDENSADVYSDPKMFKKSKQGNEMLIDKEYMEKFNYRKFTDMIFYNKKLCDYIIIENGEDESAIDLDFVKKINTTLSNNFILAKCGNNLKNELAGTKLKVKLNKNLVDELNNLSENNKGSENVEDSQDVNNKGSKIHDNQDVNNQDENNQDENNQVNELLLEILGKNTVIGACDYTKNSLSEVLADENSKKLFSQYIGSGDSSDVEMLKQLITEKMLSSNADVCIIDLRDILKNNKTKTDDKGDYQIPMTYQSEKYFEYLKQAIANKNR